jgi:hypothetical protein
MYDSIVHCQSAITRTQLRSNSFYPTRSRPTLAPHMVLTPERPWCQTCTCSTILRGINHYVTRGPRRREHYFGVISSKMQHHRGMRAVRMGARPGLITNPWIESLSLRAPTAPVSAIPINFHIRRERQRHMTCVSHSLLAITQKDSWASNMHGLRSKVTSKQSPTSSPPQPPNSSDYAYTQTPVPPTRVPPHPAPPTTTSDPSQSPLPRHLR